MNPVVHELANSEPPQDLSFTIDENEAYNASLVELIHSDPRRHSSSDTDSLRAILELNEEDIDEEGETPTEQVTLYTSKSGRDWNAIRAEAWDPVTDDGEIIEQQWNNLGEVTSLDV